MFARRAFFTALPLFAGLVALAQTLPTTINYQGRLTDNTPQQNPVNATVPMRFAVWDASADGTNLWQEPATGGTNVPVAGGIFNIALGSNGVPLPASVFSGASSARYLEITLNPNTPQQEILAPRQLITSTGYANLAESANNALSAATALIAANATNLGGVAADGWQKALTTPSCPANQFYTGIAQNGAVTCAPGPAGPIGPQGPAGPTSIASCPSGMTQIDLQYSTLCYAVAPQASWDAADQRCFDSFRSGLCSLEQWRMAVCRAGLPNPGRSWTATPTGAAVFSTVAGCTADSIASFSAFTALTTTCCIEWPRY